MKTETKQKAKRVIWEHPYISFDEGFELSQQIGKMGGVADTGKLAKAIGKKVGGWFALQVASIRRWGLVEGKKDLRLSDLYRRIVSPRSPGDDLKAKIEAFMNIPLFKEIYDKYGEHGLPEEPYFTNVLREDYGLQGRNPSLIATITRGFFDKYITSNNLEKVSENISQKTGSKINGSTPLQDTSSEELEGEYPIRIITKDGKPFEWDIHTEADWKLIMNALEAIKARWESTKNHGRKSKQDLEGTELEK